MNTTLIASLALALPLAYVAGRGTAAEPAPAPAAGAGASALPAEAPPAGTYAIDTGHSAVLFHVTHLDAARFWGRFNDFSGEFTIDPKDPSASKVLVVVQAESVDTHSDGRDQHLRRPDFFNAKEFPEIVFESKTVQGTAKGLKIQGELTLLGKTKAIDVEAEYIGTSEGERFGRRAGYEVRFTFDRTEFGMNYMANGGGLGNEVGVVVSLEGVLKP
jgi:polyisoprenoid-binding protein YceI